MTVEQRFCELVRGHRYERALWHAFWQASRKVTFTAESVEAFVAAKSAEYEMVADLAHGLGDVDRGPDGDDDLRDLASGL